MNIIAVTNRIDISNWSKGIDMAKQHKIECGNVEMIATTQPSGRTNLSYTGSDSLIRDFVSRVNSEETTLADVIISLEDVYGEDGVTVTRI